MRITIFSTRTLLAAGFAVVAMFASLMEQAAAQQNRAPAAAPANNAGAEIAVLPVRGSVYMLVGAGGNITASIGPDGVLLVDSGLENMASKVLAAVNRLGVELETKGLP